MVNAVAQSRDFDIDPFLGDLDDSQSVASAVSTSVGVKVFFIFVDTIINSFKRGLSQLRRPSIDAEGEGSSTFLVNISLLFNTIYGIYAY
jgi:hypothetical protein